MDYQSLHNKTVAELRKLARDMSVRVPAGTKKDVLIDMLLTAEREAAQKAKAAAPVPAEPPKSPKADSASPEAAQPRHRGRPSKREKAASESPEKPSESTQRPPEKPKPAPAKAESKVEPAKPAPPEKTAEKKAPSPVAPGKPVERKPAAEPAPAEKPVAPAEPSAEKPAVPEAAKQAEAKSQEPQEEQKPFVRASGNRDVQRTVQRAPMTGRVVRQFNGENRAPQTQLRQTGFQRVTPRQGMVQRNAPEGSAPDTAAPKPQEFVETGSARGRREGYYNAEYKTSNPAVPEMLSSGECSEGAGVLEIQQDGYGFLRAANCLPGPDDVYISIAQIWRFNLRVGDYVVGKTRPQREGDRYSAMLYITSVNGQPPEAAANRPRFEDLVPIYPDERLKLERPQASGHGDISLRLIDMLAPIGKGQRGMIVSQPKAGKTTLLKKIANAITEGYPEIKLIVMLIDERPEEVTDMKRSINGEVVYSTFDEAPENHVRVSEMVLERAQRLVEMGQDVVVLMDSITRLARAYNLVITPTGRSLSGGLDPGALFKPKRFFGAARNIENGGSLTVIATALVDTGSRMDDIIFEEFKGTGNMELHLDRKLSDKRVFPAIDMVRSGTRREELLLSETELDGEMLVRRVLAGGKGQDMTEQIISLMGKTGTNAEFYEKMKGWIAVFEKEGYSLGGKQ